MTETRDRSEALIDNSSSCKQGKPRMRLVITSSVVLGIVWNLIAVSLLGGNIREAFAPAWLLAGALAGIAAGRFTIWSRERRSGRESFLFGVGTYYLGILVYWIGIVVIQRVILCAEHGGWTDFDLHDQMKLIVIFTVYGTLWFGIILIPLAFLSRHLLWKIYNWPRA